MAVGDVGSTYADYYLNNSNAISDSIQNKANNSNMSTATDEELMDACKEFEAYFVEQMYKAMEKTVIKADEEENEYEEYFGDMRVQEYAKMVTEGEGIGIAQNLYEQMKRNYEG